MRSFPYDLVINRLLRHELILFLGEGITGFEKGSEFPLRSRELSEYLAAKTGYPRDESPELERVAQFSVEVNGRGRVYEELHRIYAQDFSPNAFHSFLAGLPARLRERGVEAPHQLILTMNYDDCLERAFETHNEPYDVLTYKVEERGGSLIYLPYRGEPIELDRRKSPFANSGFTRTVIFKLLGGINRVDASLDSFAITEDDFIDYFRDSRSLPDAIAAEIANGTVLYLGCNTRAQALRVVLNRVILRRDLRRVSLAVQPSPDPIDLRFWASRNVELLDSPLTEFLETLNSNLEVLLPAASEPSIPNEREAVRRAPAEYIGATDHLGFQRLIQMVVENSLEQVTAGYCDTIEVSIHDDNSLTVIDNGVGLPVERTSPDEKTLAELAMTRLSVLADIFPKSPPTDELQQISLALVNFLSESLHLEIWRDGVVYEQDYVRGEPLAPLSQTGKSRKRGKGITFKLDADIFGTSEVSLDWFTGYLREQAFLIEGVRIIIKDERGDPETSHEFFFKNQRFVDALSSSKYDDRLDAIRYLTASGGGPIIGKLFLEAEAGVQHPIGSSLRQALGRMGRQEIGDIFFKLTTDQTPSVAEAARSALAQIGITNTPHSSMLNAYALIIAIDDYEHRALKLRYTVRDAEGLARALVGPDGCGYLSQNVKLLLNKQATAQAIRDNLNKLIEISKSDPEATFFLYFGGHGARAGIDTQASDSRGTLNLIPVDFVDSNESTIIKASELVDYLHGFSSKRNLLVLDCSYAALFPYVPNGALLASAAPDELAFESEQGSFTSVLTAALRGDVESNDGFIRIFDLFEYLQSRVTRLSKDQHPVLYADSQNNFPIGLRPGGASAPAHMDQEGFHYDVYISFADEGDDSAWVRKTLIPFFEQANLRVAISHNVEAHQTVSRVANAQRGVGHARRTLLVLSPKYLQTEMRDFETALSLTTGSESRSERLIPLDFIPMRSSDVPAWLSGKRLQWQDAPPSSTNVLKRLVEELKTPLAIDFAARRTVTRRINGWLTVPTPRTCLIVGSPGSGKTSLVQWVARVSEGRADNSYPNLRQAIVVSTSLRDGLTAAHVIDSLSRQLSRLPEFATALHTALQERSTTESLTAASHFYLKLASPLRYLYDREKFTRTILITIDGLDEFSLETRSDIVDFVRNDALPAGVRFLLTSRPNPVLLSGLTPFLLNVDDMTARQEQLARLSSGAQKALLWAEGLRGAQLAPQIYSEYLLAGLYQNASGPTRRLLTLFEDKGEVSADLEVFANAMGTVYTSLSDERQTPPIALDDLNLSIALEKVLEQAEALATAKQIGETELLGGFLVEPTNQSGKFIANIVQAPQETLARIITERTTRVFPFDRIWRASGRRPLFLELKAHQDSVTALAFSVDGRLLYSGDAHGRLHVWDATSGRHIRTWSPSRADIWRSQAVQSIIPLNDDHVLVGWRDGVVGFLTARLSGEYKLISTDQVRGANTTGFNAIDVSHQQILIGHQDGNISIWGLELKQVLEQLTADAPVTDLAVTPDGRFAVSLTFEGSLQVWDLASLQQSFGIRRGDFRRVAVLPDSQRVVCSFADDRLAIFEILKGIEVFELPGQRAPIAAMVIIGDGRQLLTASKDGSLRAWDLEKRTQIFADRNGPWEYTALAVSPDGRTIATGSSDTIVRLWDRTTLFPFPPPAPPRPHYRIVISPSAEVIAAGQQFTLQISLVAAQSATDAFELPRDVTSLACFISSDDRGLRLKGSEAATLRRDPTTGQFIPVTFELHAQWPGTRSYSILLFADSDSPQSRIYESSGQIRVKPPVAGEPRLPLLPALDVRLAPQPDFVLQIDTEFPEGVDGPQLLTYRLSSRLPHLPMRNQEVGTVSLPAGELSRLRTLLHSTLQSARDEQPEDTREQLLSFGTYLFDRFFPADTTTAFREAFWTAADQLTTWLFVEDGVTWAPWEMLVPYREADESRSFLAERFQLSRWLELGPSLYSEVPFGDLALAHYKDEPDEELKDWAQLLDAVNAGGIAEIVKRDKPCYRLHLLRYTDESGSTRRGLVPRHENITVSTPTEDAKRARLDLRLNRPVITLSILDPSGARTELKEDWPLPDRVMPFLRAGASAVIGPWWPTSEAADHIFWLNFYDLVEARVPLGEAVWHARKIVKQALPGSSDWLAYTLFGDPRARAYKPAPSEGYTILERLYADQPVHLGEKCYFRASISNRPSLFYQERLVQAEDLPKQPMALFIAPGQQDNIPEPVEMKLVSGSTVEAIYELTPVKAGKFALIARLYDGDERLQSLQLPFVVE